MNNKKLTLGLLVLSVMLFVGASNASAQVIIFAQNSSTDIVKIAEDGTASVFMANPNNNGQVWEGMTADLSQNLYRLSRAGKVMKITPGGEVSLFADLSSVSANNLWMNIVFDASGDLYALNFASLIARITPAGAVSTVATNLSSIQASGWTSLMTDGLGNITVANYASGKVAKIDNAGSANQLADLKVLSPYEWNSAVPDFAGNIYALDSLGRVAKITSAGLVDWFSQGLGGAYADGGWRDMAIDEDGNLYPVHMSGEIAKVLPDGTATLFNSSLKAILAAGWTGGLVVMTPNYDLDGDGIENAVDTDILAPSLNFNDGVSYGAITATGGWTISVTDLPAPEGVRLTISGSGTGIAKFLTCNNNVETQLDVNGEIADILCGSTTVTAVNALPDIRVREPQGGTGGKATLVKLITGQIVKMGSYVAASPLNESAILVEVVDNNDSVLGSGSLLPGQTLDIEPNGPNNTVLITNQSSETVEFTFNGELLTMAPDEALILTAYPDFCPDSTTDVEPNENRFSWLGGDNFMTRDPKTKELVASPYTLEQTKGCTCAQILEKTSGQENGQVSAGCTKEAIESFANGKNLFSMLYGNLQYLVAGALAALVAFGRYL